MVEHDTPMSFRQFVCAVVGSVLLFVFVTALLGYFVPSLFVGPFR